MLVSEIELQRVREIALALPEVNERVSHGAPCFFVRDQRPLCYFHDDDFDDRARVSLMCPAGPGVAQALVAAEPGRFYRPATSARGVFSDWLGVFLDDTGDYDLHWGEVAAIIEDAYRVVAPSAWPPGSTTAEAAYNASSRTSLGCPSPDLARQADESDTARRQQRDARAICSTRRLHRLHRR